MKRILFNPVTLVCLIVAFLIGGWLLLLPAQIAGKVKQLIEQRTGRSFEIAGGAGFTLSPQLGLNLGDVTFAGASAMAEPVLKSKTMFVPISIHALMGEIDAGVVPIFSDADITVAFNAQGHANVLIDQSPDASKTDVDTPEALPTTIQIQSGTFHFSDARDGSAFTLPQIAGSFTFGGDSSLVATGSAEINERHAEYSGSLKSLERAFGEGSPVDFNLDSDGHAFSFSGRLAANVALNLAGQGSVESSNAQQLFKWFGVDLNVPALKQKFSLSGPFELQGTAFGLKKSELQLGDVKATGDIAFSKADVKPSLIMQLDFDALHVAGVKTAKAWSEAPIDVSVFQNLDMQFKIAVAKFSLGAANLGAAVIDGTIKDAVMTSTFKSDFLNVSQLNFDASQVPPTLALNFSAEKADAKAVLPALTGQSWLSGPLNLNAVLSARGKSQAEMISTLNGTVDAQIESGALLGTDLNQLPKTQDGWSGAKTDFSTATAKFSIVDGIASIVENHLEGAGLSVSAAGDVDLLRQSLTLSLEPIEKQKILLNGPWDHPKISAIAPTLH
jgi:AsmA protein